MGEVIKNSNFRKLFLSNLFSGVGQGMTMIGISWYMIELTGTARLLGSTMIISAILTLLIGPFAGTMIDRFSRKAILQFEQLAGFTVLLTVSVWGWLGTYSEWMMVSFIYQVFSYFICMNLHNQRLCKKFLNQNYTDLLIRFWKLRTKQH